MKALVTGGGGFLGGAVVQMLRERGDQVRSFARGDYPALRAQGVEVLQGDLSDPRAVAAACEGVDVVFHVAAKAGVWGPFADFYEANVVGTEHVIAGCRAAGVTRLVFTSSPSVVFNGQDMEGVDESVPYPDHYEGAYSETKAIAEQRVLAANSPELATVSLRPHLIWGPGDNHLTPRIVARGRAGRLRKIGFVEKRVDATYIDNAAHAHLLAADRLAPGSPVAGKAYFIAQDAPLPTWELVNRILAAADVAPVTGAVPAELAYAAGAALEAVYGLFKLTAEPPMTRFVARELATAHWFDLAAAKRDLGYKPLVSTEEGLARLRHHLAAVPV